MISPKAKLNYIIRSCVTLPLVNVKTNTTNLCITESWVMIQTRHVLLFKRIRKHFQLQTSTNPFHMTFHLLLWLDIILILTSQSFPIYKVINVYFSIKTKNYTKYLMKFDYLTQWSCYMKSSSSFYMSSCRDVKVQWLLSIMWCIRQPILSPMEKFRIYTLHAGV